MGQLEVGFDAQGVPVRWQGAALPLDATVAPDPEVEAKIAQYNKKLEAFTSIVIGQNNLNGPDGLHLCRVGECLSGLIATDSMLDYGRAYGVQVALWINGGGLRTAASGRTELW